MAIFGYGRVSTKEQQSENQRLELERAGYDVTYWYADEGVSGKVPALQREQFRILLDKMRDRETLVVTKLDRLGRDALRCEGERRGSQERRRFQANRASANGMC